MRQASVWLCAPGKAYRASATSACCACYFGTASFLQLALRHEACLLDQASRFIAHPGRSGLSAGDSAAAATARPAPHAFPVRTSVRPWLAGLARGSGRASRVKRHNWMSVSKFAEGLSSAPLSILHARSWSRLSTHARSHARPFCSPTPTCRSCPGRARRARGGRCGPPRNPSCRGPAAPCPSRGSRGTRGSARPRAQSCPAGCWG